MICAWLTWTYAVDACKRQGEGGRMGDCIQWQEAKAAGRHEGELLTLVSRRAALIEILFISHALNLSSFHHVAGAGSGTNRNRWAEEGWQLRCCCCLIGSLRKCNVYWVVCHHRRSQRQRRLRASIWHLVVARWDWNTMWAVTEWSVKIAYMFELMWTVQGEARGDSNGTVNKSKGNKVLVSGCEDVTIPAPPSDDD